jgi:hypothetical protein
MQISPQIDLLSLSRWCKGLGEVGTKELRTQSVEAAKRAKLIKSPSLQQMIISTTVMGKAIVCPTDSTLLQRSREHFVKAAQQCNAHLQQITGVQILKSVKRRSVNSELKAMITRRTANEWTVAHMKTAGKTSRDWAKVRLEMRRMQSFTVPDTTFDA